MAFKWKDSFSVNIVEVDNQHKKLFDLGSQIYDLASLNDQYDHYDEIIVILGELKDYTIYHFENEERLMEKYDYPDLESHQIEHSFFIKKLERIGRSDIDGQQGETIIQVVDFLADWISKHILETDMKYKAFLNEKGVN